MHCCIHCEHREMRVRAHANSRSLVCMCRSIQVLTKIPKQAPGLTCGCTYCLDRNLWPCVGLSTTWCVMHSSVASHGEPSPSQAATPPNALRHAHAQGHAHASIKRASRPDTRLCLAVLWTSKQVLSCMVYSLPDDQRQRLPRHLTSQEEGEALEQRATDRCVIVRSHALTQCATSNLLTCTSPGGSRTP
jgi:hypothetical protein